MQTVTGSPVKVLEKAGVRLHLDFHEFNHQMLVTDIVWKIIVGTDIMNACGFVVDIRENVLRGGQEKIKLYLTKMTWPVKQVVLAEKNQQV